MLRWGYTYLFVVVDKFLMIVMLMPYKKTITREEIS